MANRTAKIALNIKLTSRDKLKRLGYDIVSVSWDDTGRVGGTIGVDYADWTLVTKDGLVLNVIRKPNFTDEVLTMYTKDIAVVVGNEKYDGDLVAITLREYLENFGKYNPHVPRDTNLSNGDEEQVTIRYSVVVVPEDEDGSQEVVSTCYNYKTYDSDNPKNYLVTSTHLGAGSRTDGKSCEKVFLLKTNEDGSFDDAYFKITNENMETDEQKQAVETVLGTRSTGTGRNRIQNITIPREKDPEPRPVYRSFGYSKEGLQTCWQTDGPTSVSASLCPKSVSTGNVSYGSSAGKFTGKDKIKTHKRDKSLPCTITFTYYLTTKDGNLTDGDIQYIDEIFKNSYNDEKASWHGSLVTGEQASGKPKSPPIKIPKLTQKDIDEHYYKTTHFPKDLGDVQNFP